MLLAFETALAGAGGSRASLGTLSRGKQSWAVIQAPDGTVHRVQVGNHLGQNSGKVTKITEAKVEVIEFLQGGLGDWVEREAALAITE